MQPNLLLINYKVKKNLTKNEKGWLRTNVSDN